MKNLLRVCVSAWLLLAAGCEEVGVGPSGTSDDTVAPASIIGRTVEFDPSSIDSPCGDPRVFTLRFVNGSTIRGISDDGEFDRPTIGWSYDRTGDRTGELEIEWEHGVVEDYSFTFSSESRGTYSSHARLEPPGGGRSFCSTQYVETVNARGTFRLLN